MVELPNGMSSPPLTVMNWVDGANFTSAAPQVDQDEKGSAPGVSILCVLQRPDEGRLNVVCSLHRNNVLL